MNSSVSKTPIQNDSPAPSIPALSPAQPPTTLEERAARAAFEHALARYRRAGYEWFASRLGK